MAEQTFKSPGFFEQEIDLAVQKQSPTGTPAGVIGSSEFGPAFVPVTIGSFTDFESRFGSLNPEMFGPYAVREFLKYKDSITFMRVLGSGANNTEADILNTLDFGIVKNAGFVIKPRIKQDGATNIDTPINSTKLGMVQFITALHKVPANADIGYPIFTDNESFPELRETTAADDSVALVRGVLFTTTGSAFFVGPGEGVLENKSFGGNVLTSSVAAVDGPNKSFKLVLASNESGFGSGEMGTTARVYSASLDPLNVNYIGKVLNTDPKQFQREKHLLYLDLPVEDVVASTADQQSVHGVAVLHGHETNVGETGAAVGGKYRDLFGRFDTRYQTPRTTKFISQPFGNVEYDLFHFECLSDGAYANSEYKISIANLRVSSDPNNKYGIFDVQVRRFDDTDQDPEILERYAQCSLNPNDERFIGKVIGDKKVKYDFDAADEDERRLVISGKYPNKSLRVRIVIEDAVYRKEVPEEALPFGFKGIPVLKTTATGIYALEHANAAGNFDSGKLRLASSLGYAGDTNTALTSSILPPLPMRFKVSRGEVSSSPYYVGTKGTKERIDSRLYWGVKFEKVGTSVLNSNVHMKRNPLVKSYTKFQGIAKLDMLHDESEANTFNSNKFTLARVALYNTLDGNGAVTAITGSAAQHMLEASYLRNGSVDSKTYTITDPIDDTERITLATLVNNPSSVYFNRFSAFAKFNNVFYGGYDGLNILDPDIPLLNDQASSTQATAGGKGGDDFSGGLATSGSDNGSLMGSGKFNNVIASYRKAVEIMTDPMTVKTNLLAIPNIREPFITNHAMEKIKDYSMAMYVMDIPAYDEDGNRLFIDSKPAVPDVDKTAEELEGRVIDNNYTSTYFPDVFITDPINNRRVLAPSSIAALGALGYNDSVSYPWFAPAGFNRGALGFVENVKVRLSSQDRDTLYESRINPIASFPDGGFVIFGQKTLQMAKSALDRVNVRRLMLEVKRQIIQVANLILFEQDTAETRQRFVNMASPRLALIQAQAGIEAFSVVMDASNNPAEGEPGYVPNRVNGKITVIPTRTVEFISIDFIITNSGVAFE